MSTRRGFLARAAGITTTVIPFGAGAAIHPDAALIAMGEEAKPLAADYLRFTAAFLAMVPMDPDLDRVAGLADPACARLDELVTVANVTQATTLAGLKAKAVLLEHVMHMDCDCGGVIDVDGMDPLVRLAWSLTRDLVAAGGA